MDRIKKYEEIVNGDYFFDTNKLEEFKYNLDELKQFDSEYQKTDNDDLILKITDCIEHLNYLIELNKKQALALYINYLHKQIESVDFVIDKLSKSQNTKEYLFSQVIRYNELKKLIREEVITLNQSDYFPWYTHTQLNQAIHLVKFYREFEK